MKRPFDAFEQQFDLVVIQASPNSQRFRSNFKGRRGLQLALHAETDPERTVDRIFEGSAGPLHLGFELRRDIVINGKCRSHIVMLADRHHDVYRRIPDDPQRDFRSPDPRHQRIVRTCFGALPAASNSKYRHWYSWVY